MKRLLQIALPIGVLAIAGVVVLVMFYSQPEPPRRPSFAQMREVVVRPLEREDYQIRLHSQGTVQARTTSTLIPEVRGSIIAVSPNFQEGAFFEKGDVLLEIDPRDYETELVVAEAALAQAELRYLEEKARYDQAKSDWERLNPGQEANALTLREPQLHQASAAVASAEARVETARVNLERTRIRAPYAGRVLAKNVDVGQYVSPGNQLARVYAVDYAEVRLPLTATQFAYLDLPAIYRGENPSIREGPMVVLSSTVAGETHRWRGRVVRAEGSVDTASRQIFVVAQVPNPYGRSVEGRPPLKVGSFVEAEIEGKVIAEVFVMPRKLLRENRFMLMVDKEGYLTRKEVKVVWETDDVVVVSEGVSEGDRLCLTNVPYSLDNAPVTAVLESRVEPEAQVEAADVSTRRAPRPSGGGGFIARILEAIPEDKPLPEDLKARLDAAIGSGDRSAIRPVMGEIRAWAEANGVELPMGPGGGPRG